MQVEGFERHLRQVGHRHRQLTGGGIGMDVGRELGVDPEAVEDHEQPVLVARLRFADVERAVERRIERRRPHLDRPDLRVVRAAARLILSEAGLGVAARGLAVRRVGVDRQAGGSVSVADRSFEGVGASPSRNWRARSSMSMPDGASASAVVRPRLKTGSKRWFSQPVVSG